jgi:hypothetical protein
VDEHLHGGRVAQAAAGRQRVAGMLQRRVSAADRRRDATLRQERVGRAERPPRRQRDGRALLGGTKGAVQAGQPGADDQEVGGGERALILGAPRY